MNPEKSHWPTIQQWILIFVVCTWLIAILAAGVLISIFHWLVKYGGRLLVSSILIGALAQPAGAQISTYDPAGNVTLILETGSSLGEWQESAWRVVLAVDKRTMIGQSLVVYSNSVPVATLATLPPPTPDGIQFIDLSACVQIAKVAPSKFIRWRVPTHDLSQGIQPQSTIVIVACGVVVLVVGGIAIYQIVKVCNRLLPTNNVGTNLNFRVRPVTAP